MADFLTLNRIPFPIGADSFNESPQPVGDASRSVSGQYRKTEIAFKRSWSGMVQISDLNTRIALKGIVRGLGEHFGFNDTIDYSSRGRKITSSAGANLSGSYYLSSPASLSLNLGGSWVAPFGPLLTGYTLKIHRRTGSIGWNTYTITYRSSDARIAKWLNGSRSDGTSTVWASVNTSTAALTLSAPAEATWFEEVIALPFWTPDDLAGYLSSSIGVGALPRLVADGVGIENGPATVIGELAETHPIQAVDAGVWSAGLGSFEFNLIEV